MRMNINKQTKARKIKMKTQQLNKSQYVGTLEQKLQFRIIRQLKMQGFQQEDIEMALNSRISDLEDCLELSEVFGCN